MPPPPGRSETPLPRLQYAYDGLPAVDETTIFARRERVFLVLAGLFLGSLAMLNILGISRFIVLGSVGPAGPGSDDTVFRLFEHNPESMWNFAVAVGVLPYPITFLCTDLISELYGRTRANRVVWVGLLINLWVVVVLWVGGALPGFEAADAAGAIARDEAGRLPVFYEVRALAFGAVTASMIAYAAAQFIDGQVFHFWMRVTKGRHLWLRNNGSTLVSQLVDTVAVISITHYVAGGLPMRADVPVAAQLAVYVATGYAFKLSVALIDTGPFYAASHVLRRYLRLPPPE